MTTVLTARLSLGSGQNPETLCRGPLLVAAATIKMIVLAVSDCCKNVSTAQIMAADLFAILGTRSNTSYITKRNHPVYTENMGQMLVTSPAMWAYLSCNSSIPTSVHSTDLDTFNCTTHYKHSVLGNSLILNPSDLERSQQTEQYMNTLKTNTEDGKSILFRNVDILLTGYTATQATRPRYVSTASRHQAVRLLRCRNLGINLWATDFFFSNFSTSCI